MLFIRGHFQLGLSVMATSKTKPLHESNFVWPLSLFCLCCFWEHIYSRWNDRISINCSYLTLHTLAVNKLNSANSSLKNHCCFLAAIWVEKECIALSIKSYSPKINVAYWFGDCMTSPLQ